ncbi:hypothetical protein [Streptomyces sp. NBC_01477]|uniref:hypothetical protein n=1 Tax=Streptomyces sp. NBC_01477 TaxID=2976015 RepID=UPI002E32B0FF|nr:hypothetical protein [Streptomyces sp. NBC_01477]
MSNEEAARPGPDGTAPVPGPGAKGPIVLRLLPWTGEGGRPCYLRTDGVNHTYMTRLADNFESVQLAMGLDLLDHVDKALEDGDLRETELRRIVTWLTEALRDAVHVAECRGERLALPPAEDAASRAADAVIDREIIR